MAAKRFGAVDLSFNTNHVLCTIDENKDATMIITFVNRGPVSRKISLAMVDSVNIGDLHVSDYLEFNRDVPSNESFSIRGVVVPSQHSIIVKADGNDINVVAYGFEEEV